VALERDIIEKVKATFSSCDAERAIELLVAAGKSGRAARCVVFVSGGSIERLRQCIDWDARDYRDTLLAGEYSGGQRLRDFTASFLIDAPEKMWISSVAEMMARCGFELVSLDTQPVEREPAGPQSAMGEGMATFRGDLGEISVTKNAGTWRASGDAKGLDLHGLADGWRSEAEFSDSLSGFILSARRPRT